MILNMHIRNDYSNWGIEYKPKKRVTTLCGKMSLPKYCGVPGLTAQEPAVDIPNSDFGWCLDCCTFYLLEVNAVQEAIFAVNSPYLTNLYLDGVRAVKLQIIKANRAQRAMSPN